MKRRFVESSGTYRMPQAGELRERVKFRTRKDAPVSDYGVEPEYDHLFTTWAKINQVSAATYHEGAQAGEIVTHRIIIRYRPAGVSSDAEITHNETVYRIRRITDMNSARRFLMLECEELGEVTHGEINHWQ
ncbi:MULTISPECIES: phage head closure protein [Serratia]|uniref:phage head closure protein n=1 Tax=Serratia TaxID=613 RepID=UPI00148D961E|nr:MULTISPECIES: phage head closure protein [Serratia]MBJ2078392.1 phage head closure protein [Serratia ureilytica]